MEAYCMKCKAKQEMSNPEQITMKNGRPATQGVCPKCGTKMFKIGKAQFYKKFKMNRARFIRALFI